MKRDAEVNAVFFLSKKTAFTPASLFIFGRRTEVMALKFIPTTTPKNFQYMAHHFLPIFQCFHWSLATTRMSGIQLNFGLKSADKAVLEHSVCISLNSILPLEVHI